MYTVCWKPHRQNNNYNKSLGIGKQLHQALATIFPTLNVTRARPASSHQANTASLSALSFVPYLRPTAVLPLHSSAHSPPATLESHVSGDTRAETLECQQPRHVALPRGSTAPLTLLGEKGRSSPSLYLACSKWRCGTRH